MSAKHHAVLKSSEGCGTHTYSYQLSRDAGVKEQRDAVHCASLFIPDLLL